MAFNPFEQKKVNLDKTTESWNKIFVKPYDKKMVDPFTRLRIILMNGAEFESVWYSHSFNRHCENNDIRRELAVVRKIEQEQQKKLAGLKPIDESILENTIGYEQLAVELTANLARREKDKTVKQALDFALLEDFDHLYRFSNLLKLEHGILAEDIVGKRTEITPGRPTICEHRYPMDNIKPFGNNKKADPITRLNSMIITAAEQQTMNWYMNVAGTYTTDIGRKLFSEIALIEEEHVSQYGSLLDGSCTWLVGLLEREYCECYLYYSCMNDETDERIRKIWEVCFEQELAHLQKANELLEKYENRDYTTVLGDGAFPELLTFGQDNIDYVRQVLKKIVYFTGDRESYAHIDDMPSDCDFFSYQKKVNKTIGEVPSHKIIDMYLKANEKDYRFEVKPHIIPELRDRTVDNTTVGREYTK